MFSVGWSQIKCQNPKCSRALFSILIYISNISGFSTFRNAKYQTACFSLFWPLQKFTHFFHMFSVLGSRSCPRYITRASCHVLSFLVLTHVSNISGFPNLKIEVKTSMFLSFLRFLKIFQISLDFLPSKALTTGECLCLFWSLRNRIPRISCSLSVSVSQHVLITSISNISGFSISRIELF